MSSSKIPILLLKTKSVPNDSYEEYFSSPTSPFNPVFVPVLEHKPNIHNLELVKKLLRDGELTRKYGGMIFTSQRAAEGFTQIVQELERGGTVAKGGKEDGEIGYTNGGVGSTQPQTLSSSLPTSNTTPIFPLYTVGPATSRTLSTLLSTSPTILTPLNPSILGANTGNGEALAKYILEHFTTLFSGQPTTSNSTNDDHDPRPVSTLPPLLFLVGEQRRAIIPNTLNSPSLAPWQRISVNEIVVYETGVMGSFPEDLDGALRACESKSQNPPSTTTTARSSDTALQKNPGPAPSDTAAEDNIVVITIFSPSGCRDLLLHLGLSPPFPNNNTPPHPSLPSQASPRKSSSIPTRIRTPTIPQKSTGTRYIVTTIGPTTYEYLKSEFGFQADVCAERPCAEGVREGVETFLRGLKGS